MDAVRWEGEESDVSVRVAARADVHGAASARAVRRVGLTSGNGHGV